jgi:HlyD family secretion protein
MELAGSSVFVSVMDRPIARRWLKPRLLIAMALPLFGLATLGGVMLNSAERSLRMQTSKITIGSVTTAPFHDFIPISGQIVPLDSVVLDAVQGGRVEQVFVEAGQTVAAGQPLIRLSDPTLELDAIARETQVIAQMNNDWTQQVSFEVTRSTDAKAVIDAEYHILRLSREVARRRPLAEAGFGSREKLDQSADELAYQRRLRDLAVEALQRDSDLIKRSNDLIERTAPRLDANLAAARAQLDLLTVRAPADGVLTGLDAHVGEAKTRGQYLGQIDQDRGFKVTIQVDEFYLSRVRPGQRVAASIDGAPSVLVVAKVYPQVKNRKFDIDLTWPNDIPHGLRRGQAVQARLELGDDVPAVVLPAGPFLEVTGGAWVFVLDHDGATAIRRPVKLGRRTIETIEVLDGLHPGDRVVTSDYTGFDRIDRLDLSS